MLNPAPADSMASRAPATLCAARLFLITRSSGRSRCTSPAAPTLKNISPSIAPSNSRGRSPVQARGWHERAGLIMSCVEPGRRPSQPGVSAQTGHWGVGPVFILEHEPGGGLRRRLFVPVRPLFSGHVGAALPVVRRNFMAYSAAAATIHVRSSEGRSSRAPNSASVASGFWPPAFAGGPCGGRSTASCVRTSGFEVSRSPEFEVLTHPAHGRHTETGDVAISAVLLPCS